MQATLFHIFLWSKFGFLMLFFSAFHIVSYSMDILVSVGWYLIILGVEEKGDGNGGVLMHVIYFNIALYEMR